VSNPFRKALSWTIPTLFVLFYALWMKLHLPQPYYAPKLRQILWNRPSGVITQAWYGRVLTAEIASIVLGTLAAWAISRLPHASWQRFGPWIAAAAALLAMIVTAAHEIGRWML